jgi:serine/threonine protein kinase
VLKGLECLHSNNIVHRDIRSENILVSVDGQVKIADFGKAFCLTNEHQQISATTSSYWTAPEMINAGAFDTKADIWSLGVTVMEMVEKDQEFFDQALSLVAFEQGPTLVERDDIKWSRECHSFLESCAAYLGSERMTAKELMAHPFISKRCGAETFKKFIQAILVA